MRRPRLDRMAGLVLAMVAGTLVPIGVVMIVAARQPLARDCATGPATSTQVEGALVYSTGADLWYSEGHPGHPRKLVDYAPPRPRPSGSPSPSASVPPPSASASASSSPVPAPPVARVLAADISVDRKLVAYLVLDPPSRVGSISLFTLSALDPPGTAPVEGWYSDPDRNTSRPSSVSVLDGGKVLLRTPVKSAPGPSPAPATPPPADAPAVAAVVVAPSPRPTVAAIGPDQYFIAEGHRAWPETKGYTVPKATPRLVDRVDGPGSRVAGRQELDLSTPLTRRRVNSIVVGSQGVASTSVTCVAPANTRPVAFSPDESELVLWDGSNSRLLSLSATHAATPMLAGRVLAWRS